MKENKNISSESSEAWPSDKKQVTNSNYIIKSKSYSYLPLSTSVNLKSSAEENQTKLDAGYCRQSRNKMQQKGNYLLGRTLGAGSFGEVKEAVHISTGEKVAIKILDKTKMKVEENDFNRMKREISILKRLRHKNIIQLYEIIESKDKLYLVTELCENHELFDYIVVKQRLTESEACKLFQELIDGVEYLHSQNIVHRDLKPENLLLDSNNCLKISDFGLSTIYTNTSLLSTPCGTPSYAPPEMLRGEEYHGLLSDLWSCGVILYAMLCGYLPFSESNEEINTQNIIDGTFEFPNYVSLEAINLISNILKVDPMERYDISQIRNHPWFSQVSPTSFPGIILELNKIPIDFKVLNFVIKEHYNLSCNEEMITRFISRLIGNKFDDFTSAYYLTIKKWSAMGFSSISDLHSNIYLEYMNSPACVRDEILQELIEMEKDKANESFINSNSNLAFIHKKEVSESEKDAYHGPVCTSISREIKSKASSSNTEFQPGLILSSILSKEPDLENNHGESSNSKSPKFAGSSKSICLKFMNTIDSLEESTARNGAKEVNQASAIPKKFKIAIPKKDLASHTTLSSTKRNDKMMMNSYLKTKNGLSKFVNIGYPIRKLQRSTNNKGINTTKYSKAFKNSGSNHNSQSKWYIEEEIYRMESVDKSQHKRPVKQCHSVRSKECKPIIGFQKTSMFSPLRQFNCQSTLSTSNNRVRVSSNEIFIKKKISLKKDIYLPFNYQIQKSKTIDSTRSRKSPITTINRKDVKIRPLRLKSLNFSEQASGNSIDLKKYEESQRFDRSVQGLSFCGSDEVNLKGLPKNFLRKELNNSCNMNISNDHKPTLNLKLSTQSKKLKAKGSMPPLPVTSRGKNPIGVKAGNASKKNFYPKMLPFHSITDIDCLFGGPLINLMDGLESALKSEKISFVKLNPFKLKCSKLDLAFNCEVLRVDDLNDNPKVTSRKRFKALHSFSYGSNDPAGLSYNAESLDTESFFNRNQQSEDLSKRNSNFFQPGASLKSNIFYLQFRLLLGNQAHFHYFLERVLQILNKCK